MKIHIEIEDSILGAIGSGLIQLASGLYLLGAQGQIDAAQVHIIAVIVLGVFNCLSGAFKIVTTVLGD